MSFELGAPGKIKTYTISGPDGKDYSIDGPEGATREQVIAKIQSRLGQSKPVAAPQAPKVDPYIETAQNQSTGKNLLAGVGGGMYGMYLGAKQLLGKATPGEIEEHKRAMEGLRSTKAGTIGDIGGQMAVAAPAAFIPGAGTLVGGSLIGGGIGALQPVAEGESRAQNMAIGAGGGAAGNLLARGVTRAMQPITKSINPGMQSGLEAAKRLGLEDQLTPGQRSGNLALQQVEGVLERTPGSAGMFQGIKDSHQAALNKAAAKSIGENADNLTEEVISRASDRIGQNFNDLSMKSNVKLGGNFMPIIRKLEFNNASLGPFRNPQIDDLIGKSRALVAMKNIPGSVYQTIRSELTSGADDAFRAGNSSLGRGLKDVRNALDDAAKAGLHPVDQKMWDITRKEYANLQTLLKGKTIKSGDVDQNLINNAMIKYNNKLYKSGAINSPLNDIGKYAETFKKVVPNSGTPERTFMQNMMFGNPLTGLPTAALANLYARGYLSKPMQSYLVNGIANVPPAVAKALERGGTVSGGVGGSNLGN